MKLRGANGRLRPWATQTSPPRMSTIPAMTRKVRTRRSYSSKCTCGRVALWRYSARRSRDRRRQLTRLPLPTTSNRRPGAAARTRARRRAMRESTWFQLNSGRGLRDLHRSGDHLFRLRHRLRVLRVRAGVLRGEGLLVRSEALLLVPRPAPGLRRRREQLRQRRRYCSGPREMHDAVCARCGNETQVPFRPTGARPVYCSDCFRMMRG